VNQGPRGDCLMKKTEGRKSRDTVPLKDDVPKTSNSTTAFILYRMKIFHYKSISLHDFITVDNEKLIRLDKCFFRPIQIIGTVYSPGE
jgi:hypothetical protein